MLDLGAGIGRHSLELARRGFKVTAIDIIDNHVSYIQKTADDENLNIRVEKQDMRYYIEPDKYHVVLNLSTSFGYFDANFNEKVLSNIYYSLKSGGKLLLDLVGREIIDLSFQKKNWQQIGNTYFLEERFPNENLSSITNKWIKLEGGERKEYCFTLKIFSSDEISLILQRIGFQKIVTFGNFQGNPYDNRSERLIIIATK